MPLTPKGNKIMGAMKEQYGSEKGESVFYASKNKGTIKGVDTKTTVSHSRTIPGLGTTRVTQSNDTEINPLTGSYPAPERHKDLLGEVSQPETTPRGPQKQAGPPERTKKSADAKKAKDQSSEFSNVQSGAPMNNLGMGIPAPNISSAPGASSSSTTTGDSLRSMNQANRAFWASRRR